MKKQVIKKQEEAIKEIIRKYGESINLKVSPYLIGEIIRNYAHIFNPEFANPSGLAFAPEPGTPPVPGKTFRIDPREIYAELSKISTSLKEVNKKLDRLKK